MDYFNSDMSKIFKLLCKKLLPSVPNLIRPIKIKDSELDTQWVDSTLQTSEEPEVHSLKNKVLDFHRS